MDEPSLSGSQTITKLTKKINIKFLFCTFTATCSHQFSQWGLFLCFQPSNNPFAFLFITINTNKIKFRVLFVAKKKGEIAFLEPVIDIF